MNNFELMDAVEFLKASCFVLITLQTPEAKKQAIEKTEELLEILKDYQITTKN